jgi:hypothetical protein
LLVLQDADLGSVDFSAARLPYVVFRGGKLSETKGLELAKHLGSGAMSVTVPPDFKSSYEDPSQFEAGHAPSAELAAARLKCDLFEDAVCSALQTREIPPRDLQDRLNVAIDAFDKAKKDDEKVAMTKYSVEKDITGSVTCFAHSSFDGEPDISAQIDARRKELTARKSLDANERSKEMEVDLANELAALNSQDRSRGCWGAKSRSQKSTKSYEQKKRQREELLEALRDDVAHLDLNMYYAQKGSMVKFWAATLGRGDVNTSKANLLAQKRMVRTICLCARHRLDPCSLYFEQN